MFLRFFRSHATFIVYEFRRKSPALDAVAPAKFASRVFTFGSRRIGRLVPRALSARLHFLPLGSAVARRACAFRSRRLRRAQWFRGHRARNGRVIRPLVLRQFVFRRLQLRGGDRARFLARVHSRFVWSCASLVVSRDTSAHRTTLADHICRGRIPSFARAGPDNPAATIPPTVPVRSPNCGGSKAKY